MLALPSTDLQVDLAVEGAKLGRRHVGVALEHSTEVATVRESAGVGNFADVPVLVDQLPSSLFDAAILASFSSL